MKIFVCRVELHGKPSVLKYAVLHHAMESFGFKRSFPSGIRRYNLPHGTYVAYSRAALDPLNSRIVRMVRSIWKDCSVMTMEVKDFSGVFRPSKES